MSSYSVSALVSGENPVYGDVSENVEGKFDYGLEEKIHIFGCRFALAVRLSKLSVRCAGTQLEEDTESKNQPRSANG